MLRPATHCAQPLVSRASCHSWFHISATVRNPDGRKRDGGTLMATRVATESNGMESI